MDNIWQGILQGESHAIHGMPTLGGCSNGPCSTPARRVLADGDRGRYSALELLKFLPPSMSVMAVEILRFALRKADLSSPHLNKIEKSNVSAASHFVSHAQLHG